MKMGRSSEWMALSMALLLRTITVALSQTSPRCQGIMARCPEGGADMSTIVTVATGLENTTIQCNPTENIMDGDTFQWFFTTSGTISDAVEISPNGKHVISGAMSQRLTVNNIILSDEGYYFCRTVRGGNVRDDMMLGACLFPYGEAKFEICSGEDNVHKPQEGCNGTENLTANEGGSVVFNVALTNDGNTTNCFNQSIQMVTLRRADSTVSLMECSNISCSPENDPKVNASRGTPNGFDINITLYNLEMADEGMYTVTADIRRPSNMMRVCIYKNFFLTVEEVPTPTPSTTDGQTTISTSNNSLSQNTLIAIGVVIVLLVLLIGLGLFVAILFLWTCKNKSKQEKESEYATIDQDSIKKSSNHSIFLRSRDKKKEIAGQGRDALYGNRDSRTDENMNLDETFNSPTGQV